MNLPLYIENNSAKEATVYSFNKDVHITTESKGSAAVYNLAGQEVATTSLSKGSNSLNVNGAAGVYVVKVTKNGNTSNHKVQLS